MNYEKISVKLPEGEALTVLTDRALNWQQKAEKILKTDEVATELKKLTTDNDSPKSGGKKTLDDSVEDDTDETDDESRPTKLSAGKRLPEVKLSAKTLSLLEDLMLEGDMMEVTMDENLQIWKLLQVRLNFLTSYCTIFCKSSFVV